MIVEMVGLPGSGKSTLAGKVARDYRLPLIRVGRLGQRQLYAFVFALLDRQMDREMRRAISEQCGTHAALLRINRHRLKSAAAKVQSARLAGTGVVDEGLLQFLLGVHERAADPAQVEATLNLLDPEGLRICFVEADDATRLSRMKVRKKVPRAELGPAYQRSWQAAQHVNFSLLQRLCASRFECLTIDNSGASA